MGKFFWLIQFYKQYFKIIIFKQGFLKIFIFREMKNRKTHLSCRRAEINNNQGVNFVFSA